jgi:transposase
MHAIVHAADIQDRDGGAMLMGTLFGLYPFLLKLYADGGYQGPVFQNAMKDIMAQVNVEIVKRSDQVVGFAVLPKRWVVERTLAWLNRCRRLAKDWECLNRKARVYLLLASIRLMVRRLARNDVACTLDLIVISLVTPTAPGKWWISCAGGCSLVVPIDLAG